MAQSETSSKKRRTTLATASTKEPAPAAVESEESFLSKMEVRIKIPDELTCWLVDDWDLVTRQHKLVSLPATKSIDSLLDEYCSSKGERAGAVARTQLNELAQGIRDYFNVMLGSQLLYKFERPQYSEVGVLKMFKTICFFCY